MFRSIIINFKVDQGRPVLAPVIWDEKKLANGAVLRSFAVITDEPTAEIKKAGHDRRPINLTEEGARSYLALRDGSLSVINEIFDQCADDYFVHGLEKVS